MKKRIDLPEINLDKVDFEATISIFDVENQDPRLDYKWELDEKGRIEEAKFKGWVLCTGPYRQDAIAPNATENIDPASEAAPVIRTRGEIYVLMCRRKEVSEKEREYLYSLGTGRVKKEFNQEVAKGIHTFGNLTKIKGNKKEVIE